MDGVSVYPRIPRLRMVGIRWQEIPELLPKCFPVLLSINALVGEEGGITGGSLEYPMMLAVVVECGLMHG